MSQDSLVCDWSKEPVAETISSRLHGTSSEDDALSVERVSIAEFYYWPEKRFYQ